MYESEHDLYVDEKELLPSLEKFHKIEKKKKKIKIEKPKILTADLSVNKALKSDFLDKYRRVTSEDAVLKTPSDFYSKDKDKKNVVMCSNGHQCVVGVSTYNTYICDGGCRQNLNGQRWFCASCGQDFCFTCKPHFQASAAEDDDESTKKEGDGDDNVIRGRYVSTEKVPSNLKHPDEKGAPIGVFEFLGKKGFRDGEFINPSFDGNVKIEHSKVYSSSYPAHAVCDKNSAQTFMDGQYDGNAWLYVDLGEYRSLVLDAFMLSMKTRYQYPCVNFLIQGSNDAKDPDSWETLSVHQNDNSMKNKSREVSRAVWNVGTAHSPVVYVDFERAIIHPLSSHLYGLSLKFITLDNQRLEYKFEYYEKHLTVRARITGTRVLPS